jgi:hypothetical protein
MAMMGDGWRVADVVASSPITLFEMSGRTSASSRCTCRRLPPPSPRRSRSDGPPSEPATLHGTGSDHGKRSLAIRAGSMALLEVGGYRGVRYPIP